MTYYGVTVNYSTCKNNFSLIWGNGLRTPGLGPRNLDSASLCYKPSRRKSNRALGKLLLRKEWKVCSQLPGMAAGENEGQVVKPAPTGKVSILMIIVVVLIITVIVDGRWKCLKAHLATCPRCLRAAVSAK